MITYKFLETQQFTHDIGCECDDFFLKVYRGITLSEESKEAYAKFLKLVLENEKGSVLFHCTSGKDRTGIASLLLLHILGVDKETIIGDHCWIASNSLIMAGVVLGPRTVVAAGSVVTKSFPDGYVLIGGNPAKVIKKL